MLPMAVRSDTEVDSQDLEGYEGLGKAGDVPDDMAAFLEVTRMPPVMSRAPNPSLKEQKHV